jgi:predicted enzyme related to lactoylglutathione lyase
MPYLTSNQPNGTPTWIELGIPDLDRAMTFYGAVLGWEFDVGPEEYGSYTTCLLDGRRAAAIAPNPDPDATEFWWNLYFAADDCDATAKRITDAGGTLVMEPSDVMDLGRMLVARDPVGAQFSLWQGRKHIGAEVVNEPGALLRNDLVTPDPGPARAFYTRVFDFTLDTNEALPGVDFTFLRRPDGHEIGGIVGEPKAPKSAWGTLFMVAHPDAAVAAAVANGGTSPGAEDFVYGRVANVTDPFGAEFSVGSPPKG